MNNMTQYFQNSKIIKAQDGSIIDPRLYSSRMYNDYIRQHGTEFWELDPKLIKRGNVKKHQSGGRTQYEIGSLPWFGREVKNLFRAIIEGRKPSDYDPRTQTFRGDGVKLQGGNFGGGGSWPTPQYAPKPDKPLLVPIVMQRSFNDAYAEARRKGQSTFWFNGRLYNTKRGGGSEAQKAGSRRFEVTKVGAMPEP